MTRDVIISKIRKCTSLPTMPTVAMKVLELARSEEADLSQLAHLISNDPALSSKVLRTVNSPFYGLTKTVSTISNALVILGIEAVKTLVLGFSLVSSLNAGTRGETQLAYWRRSIYSAVASRLLCQRLGIVEREEVFLSALLQDIGLQVFKQVAPEYDELLGRTAVWGGQLIRRERQLLGISHCEAGLLLAQQWNMPPLLSAVIGWHHRAGSADPAFKRTCQLVCLANRCAEVFMGHRDAKFVRRVRNYARATLGLNQDACDMLLAEVSCGTRDMADLLDVNIGEQKPYEEIMAEANETLQNLTFQTQIRARQMKIQAETDPLTGLANRRKLDEKLDEAFARSVKFLRPLSAIFVDADHFKSVNDGYGHDVGDQALRHLAGLLKGVARPIDVAGRYGGEEFILLLPETAVGEATRLAEEVRRQVQDTPLPLGDGKSLSFTVSLGVASFDGVGGPYKLAAHLVQAADRACYAAKGAGRNTVRVFSPRPKQTVKA